MITNTLSNYPISLPVNIEEKPVKMLTNNIRQLNNSKKLPGILIITSYPPRECGIATYSQDLIAALKGKFNDSFLISICAIESENEKHSYTIPIKYILNTDQPDAFILLANKINNDNEISLVMIQHEFGFYKNKQGEFSELISSINKPIITAFHTVLPNPEESLKKMVKQICAISRSVIVMTHDSVKILTDEYGITKERIEVIAHGTHLVPHSDKEALKIKYNLSGKKVLSTFGLLSSGKNIETTLKSLPAIIRSNPDIIFLIIGKTHPSVIKQEGYKYKNKLDEIVRQLEIQHHVQYLNYYLPLSELLEYLQLTDIYLFTSKDPNHAVSGTFSYALSCGCPIVSTPIPHALEVLSNETGIIIDFENSTQLSEAVINLLNDDQKRNNISLNGLHKMAYTCWENASIAHASLFKKYIGTDISLQYSIPSVNLDHFYKMTTDFGIIQFSRLNKPDIDSGYTLDDNARALIAMCQHFKLTKNVSDLKYINIYFSFIKYCMQPEGYFLNYVNADTDFTEQNFSTNLADSNGRAIWALGYLVSISDLLPDNFKPIGIEAESILQNAMLNANNIHSTRAMAFIIKGLYYQNKKVKSEKNTSLIKYFADKLIQMYRHESDHNWLWYESYLTYANSTLPEAMLCAWLATCEPVYKEIARSSFDFLLSKTFRNNSINVISNKGWLHKGKEASSLSTGGEQPIDVAYTIIALNKFNNVFNDEEYINKMIISFNWFQGNNHLNQIVYNPCTGGCYDGLEENYVNLNQGAESTVSFMMARLTVEKYIRSTQAIKVKKKYFTALNKNLHIA